MKPIRVKLTMQAMEPGGSPFLDIAHRFDLTAADVAEGEGMDRFAETQHTIYTRLAQEIVTLVGGEHGDWFNSRFSLELTQKLIERAQEET